MWSKAEDKTLIDMWQSGALGCDIARVLNYTRAAVMGRIARLREAGVDLARRPRIPGQSSRRRKPKPKAIVDYVIKEPEPYVEPCDIMGLRYFSCRYIVSEKPTLYCNQMMHKHSYCEKHFKLCYQVGTNVPLTAKPRPSIKYPKG